MAKVAAITGAAEGIGRATAIAFAEKGFAVSICDTNKEAGFEVIKTIRQLGGKAIFVRADVADSTQTERWLRVTADELGVPDVLINNAGIGRSAPFLELRPEDFDRVIGVNLRGTFLCSQQAARLMASSGKGGAIVNIASTRALMSEADTEAYSASKGGILALTHAMAVSLGPYGIRVNAISPGWIETSEWRGLGQAAKPQHSDRDRLQHPVGRVGRPEDIAQACLYVAGSDASFITGQNLVIDGGMTIKMIYE
ncbi:SDR family NAD(P)-dependent oxidoreductase [Xylanibacillus composti]|uniref:Oxidoreductase n=1 Tax=Xylanibacillus composti TaxID=1572762 RepID=A0A8J4M3X3_9BACL|nr:glucose 1-dehydrogenase [Xylanibacillus composti]MDT9725006.1 SDR family NAD(P)-dependent oxidoreductase [Xylanibacillus composti]GIQ71299.1 oxidoreductase [Xylanibacillus composti]